jgi:hypothetical protein
MVRQSFLAITVKQLFAVPAPESDAMPQPVSRFHSFGPASR